MRKGKTVTFTDGSRLDMKSITENNEIMTIDQINLDDIVMTYDENFQTSNFGLDGNNAKVLTSMDTLRRSINLYGQISPILVSIIDESQLSAAIPHQRYQIIDGLKRYYLAKNDGKDKIRAIIIHKKINSAKSIIRFLANEKVTRSPENIIDEARIVRSQTDDIRESFIEQILDLDFGSLEYLNRAIKNDDDKKIQILLDKFRNNEITISGLVRKMKLLNDKEKEEKSQEIKDDIDSELDKQELQEIHEEIKSSGNEKTDLEKEQINCDKLRKQKELDSNRSLSDMKVSDNGEMSLNELENNAFDKGNNKKKNDNYKERTVGQAEDLLRSKQNGASSSMSLNQINNDRNKAQEDNRQFVGERKPLPKATRMAVLERDDYHCQVCGRGGRTQPSLVSTFEIHHLQDVQIAGGDDKDNLILLCKQCHSLITNHKSFPTKPIPNYIPQYDPTTEELDDNPDMWTIMVLSRIEKITYEDTLNQIINYDSKIGHEVQHHAMTIGQAIKKLKKKLIIKHNYNTYQLFKEGVIDMYQEKANLGYKIPNQEIREEAINLYQKKLDENK